MRLQDVILRDTLANRPAATAVPAGSLYFDTTNSILYRSDGTNWASVSPAAVLADGDYGDITVGGTGTTLTIDAGAVTEAKQTLADNTTNDVSTSAHGYAPKAPNDATKYLDGTGAYSVPAGATEQKTPPFIEGSETAQIFERIQAGSNITITEIAGGEAISIAATGSSGGWALAASNTSISGSNSIDFTGLSAYSEIAIFMRQITFSISDQSSVRVSSDNGSSFYASSGDYVLLPASGTESNQQAVFPLSANHTAARTGIIIINQFNVASYHLVTQVQRNDAGAATGAYISQTSALNAVRVLSFGGNNFTGGAIYIFGR